jgi:deoxyribonuclease V
MSVSRDHEWDLTPAEGIYLQKAIKNQVDFGPPFDGNVEFVAGADVSYMRKHERAFASIKVFALNERADGDFQLELIDESSARQLIQYPYIPGLLVFREGPALEEAWQKLETKPDLILFDGAGIAHPRRCGLAIHLGWRWDTPARGCAKSRLIGKAEEVELDKGSTAPLFDKNTRIGTVVRTRTRVKPLYVSPGYRTSFEQSIWWTLTLATTYRLPEPIRLADHQTKALVRQYEGQK